MTPRARLAVALLALGGAVACQEPTASPLRGELRCEQERGLRYRCLVSLAQGDRPVEGATVVLSADMPSMPLAHHVPPATCAVGPRLGEYVGTLDFEMGGRWMVGIRVSGPRADYLTREVEVR